MQAVLTHVDERAVVVQQTAVRGRQTEEGVELASEDEEGGVGERSANDDGPERVAHETATANRRSRTHNICLGVIQVTLA